MMEHTKPFSCNAFAQGSGTNPTMQRLQRTWQRTPFPDHPTTPPSTQIARLLFLFFTTTSRTGTITDLRGILDWLAEA